MRSFLRLLRWELYKLTRRRATYIGLVLCLGFCAVTLFGFSMSNFQGLRRNSGGLIDPQRYLNGWFYTYFCISICFFTLLPLLAALVPGSQFAGEAKEGTLRALLLRPPSRPALFGAKTLVSFVWLLALVYVLIGLALMMGTIARGGGKMMIFEWEFRQYGPWFVADGDRIWLLLLTGLGQAVSLFMIASFALMLSAMTDNPVAATVGTVGGFFISSIVHQLPDEVMSPRFKAFMPTRHMGFWRELPNLFQPYDPDRFAAARFWTDLAWVGGYSLVFLVIGLTVFSRRDITS
ncbi:MAG TPA: ABC transporter permease subunit [Kofleriaceae bacterium]|jgi:hypothetical protein|nr:ABC transporter permease subunit [Kofleriaceae bacterium]